MDIEIGVPDFAAVMREVEGDVAKAATAAMRETTRPAVMGLREQITSNGLGQRLANSWRDRVYPEQRESMTPTGYIWSNAPEIIDSFVRGATIHPIGGAKYLWIPTRNVPRARGRVSARGKNLKGGAMTPQEVEAMFRSKLSIRPGRNGTMLAFIEPLAKLKGKGQKKPLLMFVLRKTVRMPKLLDLNGPAEQWADRFVAAFERKLAG